MSPINLLVRCGQFDISELPLAAYVALLARGDDSYIGLPIFPHRMLLHHNVVVNVRAGIPNPSVMRGKRAVTTGLYLSGTIWLRGILADDYGVAPGDLPFVVQYSTYSRVKSELAHQAVEGSAALGIRASLTSAGEDVDQMIESGRGDVWIAPTLPAALKSGSPNVRRLFEDYAAIERAYLERVKFIPILHLVVLRRSLYERHPWLAGVLVEMFVESRRVGRARLDNEGVGAILAPWLRESLDAVEAITGGDPFAPGFDANENALELFLRYARDQGLAPAQLSARDLFASDVIGASV